MTTLDNGAEQRVEEPHEVLCWGCGLAGRGVVCRFCMAVVSEAFTILQNIIGGYTDNAG